MSVCEPYVRASRCVVIVPYGVVVMYNGVFAVLTPNRCFFTQNCTRAAKPVVLGTWQSALVNTASEACKPREGAEPFLVLWVSGDIKAAACHTTGGVGKNLGALSYKRGPEIPSPCLFRYVQGRGIG